MPFRYDFAAADQLYHQLLDTSQRVAMFAGNRAKRAGTDLASWWGRKYDDFRSTVTSQQAAFAQYSSDLRNLAAHVFNATQDASAAMNPQTRTQPPLPTTAQPPMFAKVPSHTGKPGLAAAVPVDLYRYSDQSTADNDGLQKWLSPTSPNGLAQAAQQYYALAPTTSSADANLTPDIPELKPQAYPGGQLPPILYALLADLRGARTTDADVRGVGQAFEKADPGLPPNTPAQAPDGTPMHQYLTLTVPEGDLNRYLAEQDAAAQADQQYAQGTQLARYLAAKGVDEQVRTMLHLYQNDPNFMAGFYNNLTFQQLAILLSKAGDPTYRGLHTAVIPVDDLITGLVSAYHGGRIDPATTATLMTLLKNGDPGYQNFVHFNQRFFAALSGDPQAATNFVATMSDDDLHTFLDGDLSVSDDRNRDQRQQDAFKLLTVVAGFEAGDVLGARSLLARVDAAMAGVTSDDGQVVAPAIAGFLRTALQSAIAMPSTGERPETISQQATLDGQYVGQVLAPFETWMKTSVKNVNDRNALIQNIAESLVVGAAFGLVSGPAGLVAGVLYGAGSNVISGQAQNALHSIIPYQAAASVPVIGQYLTQQNGLGAASILGYAEQRVAENIFIRNLVVTGNVEPLHGGKQVTVDQLADVIAHPDRYEIVGTNGKQVSDVVAVFDVPVMQSLNQVLTG